MNFENLVLWLEEGLGIPASVQLDILTTLLTILLLWVLNRVLTAVLNRSIKRQETRYQWQKISGYLIALAGLLITGKIWLAGMETLVTFLGLLSAGMAIALKDPLMNIAGWMYILARKPFDVGDRIEISEVAGDIVDLGIFHFSIMEIGNWVQADQSTGRVLHIPNGITFNTIVSNYTRNFPFIWNELEVLITFESHWQKAKEILQEIASDFHAKNEAEVQRVLKNNAQPYLIKTGTTTPIVYTSLQASGILLSIRYLCKPRYRRSSTNILWEQTLRAFAQEPNIHLAYPTQRFYNQHLEKTGLWQEEERKNE